MAGQSTINNSANIRVYRVRYTNGSVMFEIKTKGKLRSGNFSSIESAVIMVHTMVSRMHRQDCMLVSVDFTPFHDMECPLGHPPRLCEPLSKPEQAEFWRRWSHISST